MTTNIQIFKNDMFGEVRTMTNEKGETFFVGKDVAQALGYAKSRNALAAHVDDEDKKDALIQGPLDHVPMILRQGHRRDSRHCL